MLDNLIVPCGTSLWDSFDEPTVPGRGAELRAGEHTGNHRSRDQRLAMLGSGYRAAVDGQGVTLVNLSLTGAQVRGLLRVVENQPTILKIGWPQDETSCAAIARVKWVQQESGPSAGDCSYRMGLTFETWDVRRMKDIMRHCSQGATPRPEKTGRR